MKPRTVIVTLELETDEPLKKLREPIEWTVSAFAGACRTVRQVTVSVAQPAQAAKAKKRAGMLRPYRTTR